MRGYGTGDREQRSRRIGDEKRINLTSPGGVPKCLLNFKVAKKKRMMYKTMRLGVSHPLAFLKTSR